jgi:ABC-type multidrug transport system ATPase subunit
LYRCGNRRFSVGQLLARVGLDAVANEPVGTFSRGMEQRLTLARATIAEPDVLLMDEPFTALDGEGVRLALGLIEEAMNRGGAAIITAHEALQLGRLSFTSYALRRGRLWAMAAGAKTNVGPERSAAAG